MKVSRLDLKKISYIREAINRAAVKYIPSFQYHDIEDMKSAIFCYLYDKTCRVYSDEHFRNWANLCAKRLMINQVRDLCNRNKNSALELNEDYGSIEIIDWHATNNYLETLAKVKKVYAESDPRIQKIIDSVQMKKDDQAQLIGLGRRQINNKLRAFRKLVNERT